MKNSVMNLTKICVVLVAICMLPIFNGCSPSYHKELEVPKTPRYITPPQRSASSLQTSDGSLFVDNSRVAQIADFRAYDINDLVTVRVVESTTATNTADVSTTREDTGKRGLTELLGLQNRLLPRSVDPTSAVNASTDDEFESEGSNRRAESLTSTLTARVIDRLPNGNLVIQAVREVIVNHERQVMIVQGIIRPNDIDDSNSIASTQIADLQIQYGGSGVLTENLRRGWLSRILNYVWPF